MQLGQSNMARYGLLPFYRGPIVPFSLAPVGQVILSGYLWKEDGYGLHVKVESNAVKECQDILPKGYCVNLISPHTTDNQTTVKL